MRFLFPLLLFITVNASGQDYDWWVKKHNWDGHTHWTQYMKMTQRYMGPNALPVPEINTGVIQKKLSLNLLAGIHYSKGDQTIDQYSLLFVPVGERVGVGMSVVPLEYYKMDTVTRDIRASRELKTTGFSGGDIYFTTHLQVLTETEKRPAVLLTINLKTASGTNLKSARFTDTPGYFMDFSFGKQIRKNSSNTHRVFADAGFYSYQTYDPDHAQNDAFIYGLGYSLATKNMEAKFSYGGYIGYLNDGDRPMIARLQLKSTRDKAVNYLLQIQQGILQYQYTTVRIGISYCPKLEFLKK